MTVHESPVSGSAVGRSKSTIQGDAVSGSARVNTGNKQPALLEAAARLFSQQGYHSTTVRAITEAAGVATGTFYLYFPNKEGTLLALISKLQGEVIQEILGERAGKDNVISKLAASIKAVLSFFARHEDLARILLVNAPGIDPDVDKELARLHALFADLVRQDLDEAVQEGLIQPLETAVASRALIGTLYENIMGWLRQRTPASLEEAAPTLIEYNLRGIGAQAGGPGSPSGK